MSRTERKAGGRLGWIMAVYLLGIFMGAIDTGIVSPARTIIQSSLGVDEKTGIWMITIYTLAYAAIIPISGKLADRLGRKYVYIVSVALFGTGSLICGLSHMTGSFPLLLAGRVIQALGGGGIIPVATAEFGTSFPPEKRGMALGLVGGTYGVANILGATIGSSILSVFGNNWQMLFFVNLPICAFIIIAGFLALPNTKMDTVRRIDGLGTALLVAMILSLLYGLRNIDFFHFSTSIQSADVYPFLIIFAVLLPFFLIAEKRADDPILALRYFKQRNTLVTMSLSFLVGFCLMGLVFVPQFSENALKISTGKGGYFVAILGLFAGVASPLSGVLIDRYGPKKVLYFGFLVTLLGALFLSFVAVAFSGWATVIISLVVIGFGLGFTLGTPLNYMMLDNTAADESNSALAALSLVRSIGTAIAPAIMIGFLAQAGLATQDKLMGIMPEVKQPSLPLAGQVMADINALKSDPAFKGMLQNIEIPDLSAQKNMTVNMTGGTLPKELSESLQAADVTTITDCLKNLASYMFGKTTPDVIAKIQSGMNSGLSGMDTGLGKLDEARKGIEQGAAGIQAAIGGMQQGIDGAAQGIQKMTGALRGIDASNMKAKAQGATEVQLASLNAQRQMLQGSIDEAEAKKAELEGKLKQATGKLAGMRQTLDAMDTAKTKVTSLQAELTELRDSVPGEFEKAKHSYLDTLEGMRGQIETEFQSGLNDGFRGMYITVAVSALLASVVLAFYYSRKKRIPTVE